MPLRARTWWGPRRWRAGRPDRAWSSTRVAAPRARRRLRLPGEHHSVRSGCYAERTLKGAAHSRGRSEAGPRRDDLRPELRGRQQGARVLDPELFDELGRGQVQRLHAAPVEGPDRHAGPVGDGGDVER